MRGSFGCAFVLVSTIAGPAQSQDSSFAVSDSILRAHSYHVELHGGQLSGSALPFLLQVSESAQFVSLAESHNVREIPRFTAALFKALHDAHGFQHLALEHGPAIIREAEVAAVAGGADSLFVIARRYPEAFHFRTDQELELIAEVARMSSAPGHAVWGLDHELGAEHVLRRLAALAPNPEAERLTRERIARAAAARQSDDQQSGRGYLAGASVAEFAELRRAFAPEHGSEADLLITSLAMARSIMRMNRDSMSWYHANSTREEYMVERFMDEYRAASTGSGGPPRVVLKSGHSHVTRGLNSLNVPTLGNFVSEFARANGATSLSIWISLMNREGEGWWSLSDYPEYRPLPDVADPDLWILIDLRPLRSWIMAGRIRGLPQEFTDLVFAYDLALMIGGGSRATTTRLHADGGR